MTGTIGSGGSSATSVLGFIAGITASLVVVLVVVSLFKRFRATDSDDDGFD